MPSAIKPTRTGYTFNGYFDAVNGAGTQYYNADMSSARNWDKQSNATLYASWTVNQYTVTLDKQNGTGGTDTVQVTYDSPMPTATAPTRDGYKFRGYFDQQKGAGKQYYNAYMTSANVWDKQSNSTLYAYWQLITEIRTLNTIDLFKIGDGLYSQDSDVWYYCTECKQYYNPKVDKNGCPSNHNHSLYLLHYCSSCDNWFKTNTHTYKTEEQRCSV